MKVADVQAMDDYKVSETVGSKKELGTSKAWLIIATAWAFYLYEYVLRVSPSVMTNDLMLDFNVTTTALGVLVSFYYFAYVPLQIPCGVIVDWLGPRKVITSSALLCIAGCILFSQSQSLLVAQLGRFLIGAGSACAYLSCAKLASEWFSPSKFATLTGITMMMGTFGGTFGGSPFAILVNAFGWRYSMIIGAAIGVAIAAAAWLIIRDHPNSIQHSPKSTRGNLLEGLKIIASNPQNWLIGIYACMMYLPLSAFAELWGVPFLMAKYGINNELASTATIMVFIGMGLGSAGSAWLSDRLKSRTRIMSMAALGTLFIFLVVFYVPNIPLSLMFPLLFIGGLVNGGQILNFAATKENCPSDVSGTTVGFANFFVMISGVAFQPLLGWLLDLAWDGQMTADGTPIYSLEAYQIAFSAVCAALFVSWVTVRYIRETYPQEV